MSNVLDSSKMKDPVVDIRSLLYMYAENTSLPKEIIEPIISKLVDHWLPTQQELDFTMGGLRVYADLKTSNGKRVNYGLCIDDELTELQGSIPWKHWKDINAEADLDNFKTETIDLMHFLPSTINSLYIQLLNMEEHVNDFVTVERVLFSDIDSSYRTPSSALHQTIDGLYGLSNFIWGINLAEDDLYILTSKYLMLMRSINADITNTFIQQHVKPKELVEINELYDYDIDLFRSIYSAFIGIALTFKLYSIVFKVDIETAINDIWKEYLVKNVLNVFRVNNGYKEGTYQKMWNGKEDNVVVKEIASMLTSEGENINKNLLYEEVDKYYKALK